MEIAPEEKLGRVYDLKLLKWVWSYVHPYRRLFFLSVVLMPLNSLFALGQPYIWKLTIDLFLTHNRTAPPGWLSRCLAFSARTDCSRWASCTCCWWPASFRPFTDSLT